MAKTLADFKLQIGEPVRVEIKAPKGHYMTSLVGVVENSGVFIQAPKNAYGETVLITEGNIITLRLLSNNRIITFASKLLKQYDLPVSYWLLEYPGRIESKQIRSNSRVPVNLMVSVDDFDDMSHRDDLPCSALGVDISLSGCCVQYGQTLGDIGDRFYLTTRVKVADIEHVILTPVELRNLHRGSEAGSVVINHGFKFIDLDEDSRLILIAFTYQQFLVETGNLEPNGQEL
ncbi:flagellar brake protein [Aliamphritea spongicola]|uniref:flagellar brake protein n=1 Tax=Aliamphritea spongicola TaxID=707589 RepID=UPI00196B34C9|nr:PilZ domain-containing protein [Aliamphritea spongicola]MBN3561570.1 flagellar brake protein [Aliamphritea spongicola]